MFIGVDGCKAGWFAVQLNEDNSWKVDVFPDVSSLWHGCSDASVILIDIPIGLRESGSEERRCDPVARKLLGPRRSSVFPTPCRPAIYANSYQEACDINQRLTGKRLSRETWNITAKIREVDLFLAKEASARLCIREIHPEICFWALAGCPMKYAKKKREGLLERTALLRSIYPQTTELIDYTLNAYKRKQVARDDILDALAAALTARLGQQGLMSIYETPEFDERGLRMEMVYYHLSGETAAG